uniref:Laminin G domain-containing protein n=1 Tax=Nothobranchius furzeri TaxID=105023 RepID=A0A1A8AT04_NOTFU
MGSFLTDLLIPFLLISAGHIYGVSFYGNSYIHLQTAEKSIQTLIHVQFRTSSQSGLLFLAAGRRDFFAFGADIWTSAAGFRGCMDEVVFNEHNLLTNLKAHSGYKLVHEVALGCSQQFSATEEDAVHFSSSKAFISLAKWDILQEGTFECELHPSPKVGNGMVLYNSGREGGFVAVEVRDGHLVALVGNGEGSKVELRSLTHIYSNHSWYPIQLHFLPHSVQFRIGKELVKVSLNQELQVIQLQGPLFLGGLDENTLEKARLTGLSSASLEGGSFKGCIQNIRVNTQKTGLPHTIVTKYITVGCDAGQVSKTVVTSGPTDRPEFDATTTDKNSLNVLVLRKLEVAEGGQVLLQPKHMKINLDFHKLGIHPSQLLFHIEEPPAGGQLRLNLGPDQADPVDGMQERIIIKGAEEKERTFSMLDLWQGRVMYVHNGSEDQNDSFTFTAFSKNKEIPMFLKDSHLHRLDISISPVNDAPVLRLPQGNLFTLLERSKRLLTTEILEVLDPDSSPEDLVFRSMGNLNTEAGHLEHQDYPGRAINLFSLKDLEEAASMNTSHLAVQVNVADNTVDIWYDLTELPTYGEIQRLHSSGDWKSTTFFSQKVLGKEKIRYISTYRGVQAQNNVTDQFKCKIIINSQATEEIAFAIVIHWIHLKVTRSKMEVSGIETAVLTPEDLHIISKGVKLNENELLFRLLTVPKKGQLFLNHQILLRNSTFSQKNVTDGLVKYDLFNRLHDDTRDSFSFQVFSAHAESTPYDFRINIKAESTTITFVNKGLSILEGASKVITKDNLFTHAASNREVHYNITVSPKHGQLRKINLSNSTSINDNILTFTNQDITKERIMYVHDDSETKQDFFRFQIIVLKSHKHTNKKEEGTTEEQTFNISVQLVNDQKPVRVVDRVFHVARDSQRLVTVSDLRYRDDDSDFEDSWLVYTRRGIPMGELVSASDPSHRLFEFTQRDLEQNKVLFIHSGVSFGRFVLFVTDGKHYVSALLEVVAQDPYLQVENNTGLIVQQSGITILTSANLSVTSNLDIRDPQEVTFEVFIPPKHGVLCFNDGLKEAIIGTDAISVFTQRDLVEGRVAYHHSGGNQLLDIFNVTARARERTTERKTERGRREVHLDIGVSIKIYLESHQRPPTVKVNQPLVVAEGRNTSISREHLQVVHEDSDPSEIVFTVQSPPTMGSIYRLYPYKKHLNEKREKQHLHKEQPTTLFSQEDLNQGSIIYHHQATESTNDSVLLEATNGLTIVGPIRLLIDIIPVLLPLQVEHEYISYIHDGSETLRDNFTIVANQTEIMKHSLPCTVHISITPVNDEIPVVATNRGLKVWVGSVTEITLNELSAEDSDTPPEGLEFIVTPPSNGHLALKSAPSRHILNFTQNHIQSRKLVFVHNGALSGGFHFQVNDGVNVAPRQIFSTTAHALVLTLQRNRPMEVYPGSVTPISQQDLQVVTNNISEIRRNQSVVFAVTSPPKLGRLIRRMPDSSVRNISTFTQSMVNEKVILYDQNKPQAVSWSAADTFSFTVSSPPAFLPPHTFSILISYQANEHHDNPQHMTRLVNNAGAVVAEGGSVTIDQSKLDASNLLASVPESKRKDLHIMYRVISLPLHGVLSIRGHNLTRNHPDFSQATLNKFGIKYFHDDSETTSDSFTFRAWVAPFHHSSTSHSPSISTFPSDSSSATSFSSLYSDSSSFPSLGTISHHHPIKDSVTVTEMFNITVTPVNDHPPLIRSRAPSMKVVVGERVVLGPDNLQVEDHDTPPEELHYLVISKPNNGYLTLGERPESVTSFTQYDVNHGRLHFTQQGKPSTGVFYFNVTDGHHRPLYKLFSLEVVKPSVSMVNNTGLSLVQGRTAVVLTTNQLAAQTNGQRQGNILYTVTAHPRHGRIAINDQEVVTFCQEDLQFGRVVYHMTDLSASEDNFQISVSASSPGVDYGHVPAQTVNVTVRPLIYLREPVRVPSGIAVKLGKAMIDASELARISRANPVFEVLSPPKHGKLVKITYDPNRASDVLRSFTFRDVVQGRVAIEETLSDAVSQVQSNGSRITTVQGNAPAQPLNDSFTFLLKAGNVQPAKGELHFTIFPHRQMRQGARGFDKGDSSSHETTTTHFRTHNRTTTGSRQRESVTHIAVGEGLHPDILSHNNQNKTQLLILVFRHRKEKQARLRLMHELAAAQLPAEDSPYLGRPERSLAMPNVMVTPLCSASCPTSPRVPMSPRRSLAPGTTFWGPFESVVSSSDRSFRSRNNSERDNITACNSPPISAAEYSTAWRSRSSIPSLKGNQYWV